MKKEELLKAVDALKAEIEKKPEDKIAEKLDEILRAIQALPWYPYHVCPPCTHPHYPFYPQITWSSPSITVCGNTTSKADPGWTTTNCSDIQNVTLT